MSINSRLYRDKLHKSQQEALLMFISDAIQKKDYKWAYDLYKIFFVLFPDKFPKIYLHVLTIISKPRIKDPDFEKQIRFFSLNKLHLLKYPNKAISFVLNSLFNSNKISEALILLDDFSRTLYADKFIAKYSSSVYKTIFYLNKFDYDKSLFYLKKVLVENRYSPNKLFSVIDFFLYLINKELSISYAKIKTNIHEIIKLAVYAKSLLNGHIDYINIAIIDLSIANIYKKINQSFLNHLIVNKRYTKKTAELISRDIDRFFSFMRESSSSQIADIDMAMISKYLITLHNAGLSVHSQARNLTALKAFFRFAIQDNLIRADPSRTADLIKTVVKLPVVLSVDEIKQILDAPDLKTSKGCRDAAMLELLYAAGLRISEVVKLETGSVNTEVGFVRVIGKGNKERLVPIGRSTKEKVDHYLIAVRPLLLKDRSESHLFLNSVGKPLTNQGFWKILKQYALNVGIKKSITPQTFRHSLAHHLLIRGADLRLVQTILEYTDISATQICTHVSLDRLKEVYSWYYPDFYQLI